MRTKCFLAGLLLVLAVGPVYPQNKDLLQLQRDMIELQQRVKQIQTSVDQNSAVMRGLVEKIADQVNTLAGGMQRIAQTADSLKTENEATAREMRTILTGLNTTIGELKDGISSVQNQVVSVSREITTIKTTEVPLAGANDLWRSAYVDYSAGNWDLAIGGLQEFLSKYPDHARAPDAHLFLGDALASQKKFEMAVTEYDIVLQKYSESDKSRSALLKKGLALADANQPQQAIATLTEVVKRFPGTSEANTAQQRLKELQPAQRRAPAR